MSDETPRVVVITGASQGIGASLVPAYRRLGYAVLGTSRTIPPSDDPMIATVQGDIATADTAERVTRHAIDRFGRRAAARSRSLDLSPAHNPEPATVGCLTLFFHHIDEFCHFADARTSTRLQYVHSQPFRVAV